MSKSSLSYLKGEINTASRGADSTVSNLKSLEGSILNAMDDRVGQSARESLNRISNTLSYSIDKAYKSANTATGALDKGYGRLDSLTAEKNKLLSQAKSMVKELGSI